MQVVVTIKSFDDIFSEYDFLIPTIAETMEKLINNLVTLEEPAINIEGLNIVHFTDNYMDELFAFQESMGQRPFATSNKISEGYAQVILVKDGQGNPEDVGYHIFISKYIATSIVVCQWLEDRMVDADITEDQKELVKELSLKKNQYIRIIRHELCHVEDENNQKKWEWFESAFEDKKLQSILRYDACRIWEEYYACKRSNFIYTLDSASQEISSLLSSLETAEKEICELRWEYNNQKIALTKFVALLHEYVRSAFIYGCYFMGHMDKMPGFQIDKLTPELYPSRFYPFFPDIWKALRKMAETYPTWKGPEVYDAVAEIVLKSIKEFEIYPKETEKGTYYNIPVVRLQTRSEEAMTIYSDNDCF